MYVPPKESEPITTASEKSEIIKNKGTKCVIALCGAATTLCFVANYLDQRVQHAPFVETSADTTEKTLEVLPSFNESELPWATPTNPFVAPEAPVVIIEQPIEQAPVETTAPVAAIDKKVAKPIAATASTGVIGILATLNAYAVENGKKVCKLSDKEDHPSISSKGKGIHVDEDCCIDLDEIPNKACYYPSSNSKKINSAMDKAKSNITKKLGSKVKK